MPLCIRTLLEGRAQLPYGIGITFIGIGRVVVFKAIGKIICVLQELID